jgi:putative ABC transport system permease protein
MNPGIPVAYLQLKKNPRRLGIAVFGVAMAALGILGEMGFEDSLFRSATRLFQELDADLVMISPQYQFMVFPAQFSERRLYQALSAPDVKSFSSLRLGIAPFKNPVTHLNRSVYVVGTTRYAGIFRNQAWERKTRALQDPDAVLFDARSRPEFGPVGEMLNAGGTVHTEIANQKVRIVDVFDMGASFSADGTVVTTDEGFARLFPQRRASLIDIGLIHLAPGSDAEKVRDQLRKVLPNDVLVMTHREFSNREQEYWKTTTPAGFIFKTIAILSLLVGSVSVYQILSSDITENLRQYATLKALGYPDDYFLRLTFEKAWLLASVGFPIGFLFAELVYISATKLTLVPLVMTSARAIGVYLVILTAASLAGLVAIRRLRRADLSELF